MTEQLKEALSAVVDGEADVFELRRVLDEVGRSEELTEAWRRYHLIGERLRGREDEDYPVFLERFRNCDGLAGARSVLCLGARIGTEVKALHELGYFAVGMDLNPGADNPYVLPGDFHGLVFPDGSVDVVYTNCLDHVFDLERFTAEVRRVLRPGGLFIADVLEGYEEGVTPGNYEARHWARAEDLVNELCKLGGFELEKLRDTEKMRGRDKMQDHVRQATLRKP